MRIPKGYGHLKPNVDAFLQDHPDYDANVFLIMRFLGTKPLVDIETWIRDSLESGGLVAHRADDKNYHPELWSNVCTYMLACSKSVVVFEDVELREFNPNVALELGFLLALNKPCLILKEKGLPRLPIDIDGHLWREFDSRECGETIPEQVTRWLKDLNWLQTARMPRSLVTLIVNEIKAFHQQIEMLDSEFTWERERQDTNPVEFREIAHAAISNEPAFRNRGALNDAVVQFPELRAVLDERSRIASLVATRVLAPLDDETVDRRKRIERAIAGLVEVRGESSTLLQQTESLA